MAAFNAVAGLNQFIAVAIAAVVGALVFLQVSSISLDRHGTLSRQYGGAAIGWFSRCSGLLVRLLAGLLVV